MKIERCLKNNKPYRSKALKAEAKRTARKMSDGSYRSHVPVEYHSRCECGKTCYLTRKGAA